MYFYFKVRHLAVQMTWYTAMPRPTELPTYYCGSVLPS